MTLSDNTSPNAYHAPKPKRWYHVWWKAVVGILSVSGIVLGIFRGVITVVDEWREFQSFKQRVINLESGDSLLENTVQINTAYIAAKNMSYAVGFRVEIDINPHTNEMTKRKMYRNWEGEWNEVHKDQFYSELDGVDYYFYIDKETGDKVYCW